MHAMYCSCAIMGTRREYYLKYVSSVKLGRLSEIVIPAHYNPYHKQMPGSVTGDMFEDDMIKRICTEVLHALRRFLKDYMIVTLDEIERPGHFFSLFAVTAPDRVISIGS